MPENQPTIQQLEATNKVYKLRESMNDNKLAKTLNLSKVTMYTRLKQSNWSNPEILFIEYVSNNGMRKFVNSLKIFKT